MKITIESSGGVYTTESEADHISEVIMKFKGLLVTCGYHPETVDECFDANEIEPWFPETTEETDMGVDENPNQMKLNWPGDFHNKHDRYEIYNQHT